MKQKIHISGRCQGKTSLADIAIDILKNRGGCYLYGKKPEDIDEKQIIKQMNLMEKGAE